jgi:hypothetical protein
MVSTDQGKDGAAVWAGAANGAATKNAAASHRVHST